MTKVETKLNVIIDMVEAQTAMECYLECLAVEGGEGECARAIRTKFKEYIKEEFETEKQKEEQK